MAHLEPGLGVLGRISCDAGEQHSGNGVHHGYSYGLDGAWVGVEDGMASMASMAR